MQHSYHCGFCLFCLFVCFFIYLFIYLLIYLFIHSFQPECGWACCMFVAGYSLFVTLNCACARTILFELTPLVLSSVVFWTTNSAQSFTDLKRPSYQRTVQRTMEGLTSHFLNIIGCCNFTEAKIREVCTVLLDKGLFKNEEIKKITLSSPWIH